MIGEWLAEKRATSHWLSIIASTADEFIEDRISLIAAGATFFVLLALFPAIGAIAAIYGLFGDRVILSHELASLTWLLPASAMKVLAAEMTRLAALKTSKISIALAISLVIAVWSASGGIMSLIEGLNIAFEVKERRGYLRVTATAMAIVAVGVALGVALARVIAFWAPANVVIDTASDFAWQTSAQRWSGIFVLAIVFNAFVYRYVPDRPRAERRWITWGSAISAMLWVLGSAAFSWYVQNFANYDRTYGALGAVVGFLTWIWLSLVILLLGAELDNEIARQSRE